MLPFLKNKEGSMSSPIEHVKMSENEESEYGNLDAIAEDLMHALEKKDVKMIKSALEFLVEHIQTLDEQQDKEQME